jgi:hypothetical protein
MNGCVTTGKQIRIEIPYGARLMFSHFVLKMETARFPEMATNLPTTIHCYNLRMVTLSTAHWVSLKNMYNNIS